MYRNIKYGVPYVLTEERFQHPVGTVCYRLNGYDYGLSNDDTRVTGVEHVTMTLNADGSFPGFTAPTNILDERTDA